MKIAIPTNDRIKVAERTGRAKEFAVIEIINSKVKNTDYRINTHKHSSSEQNHTHKDLVELLNDCDSIIANRFGKHLKDDMAEAKIELKLTEETEIKEIINKL